VNEPPGGAHTDHSCAAALLRPVVLRTLKHLEALSREELIHRRQERLRKLATFVAEKG